MNEDDLRLQAMGLMQVDDSPNSLREIAGDIGVPYSRLLKWRKEMREAVEEGNIHALVNTDQVILHRVAEEVQHELEEIAPTEAEAIEGDIAQVLTGIEGLNVLSDDLQKVALVIAKKLSGMALLLSDPKDVLLLVESLTKLQTAFFAKGTSVTVNNQQNNYSEHQVSKFSGIGNKI